jgi:hypothetical protein
MKAVSSSRSSPMGCGGFWAAGRPSSHTYLPPPFFWISSPPSPSLPLPAFPPHFLISATQHFNTSSIHPSSLLLFHTPCCTQDQLICSLHFVFLSFASLVVVGANVVVIFFFFSCIDPSICPTFVCC